MRDPGPHFVRHRDGDLIGADQRVRILERLLIAAWIIAACAIVAWGAHALWTALITGLPI